MNVEQSDEAFCAWMRSNLDTAADHFGLTVSGDPRWGWCLRSISAPAHGRNGPWWLRVGTEYDSAIEQFPKFWGANVTANAITGVTKPYVQDSLEWSVPEIQRRVRADVMTLLPGDPCSPTDVLRTPLDLPDSWWVELRRSIDAIRATPTPDADYPAGGGGLMRRVFGDAVADAYSIPAWETGHGDLHWSNVVGPDFGLLDWELWGPVAFGGDAAMLYMFSLLVPDVAERVYETFADILDCPAGRVAQIRVASRILFRAEEGDYQDLAPVVRNHVAPLLTPRFVCAT